MSSNTLSIRLIGDLPPSDELINMLGIVPTSEGRKGMPLHGKNRGNYVSDVWVVDLITQGWETSELSTKQATHVLQTLRAMTSGLTSLDRKRCQAELYISAICEEEQNSLELPQALVEAAGLAKLAIIVSILALVSP